MDTKERKDIRRRRRLTHTLPPQPKEFFCEPRFVNVRGDNGEFKGMHRRIPVQKWKFHERMRTTNVALVACLNIGVDPPDNQKTSPCATLECWIDPESMPSTKALEAIGAALQVQYERWQPNARYRQSLDPTVADTKKLCLSLRRNAKNERVLFHYNGHGVPRPTSNGEIWVFNRNYTQYIPLSVYDLQVWLGRPSILVFDCCNAGLIVEAFRHFSQRSGRSSKKKPSKDSILLAACQSDQTLPSNPNFPADLFTSCLTTPLKAALRFFASQNGLSGFNTSRFDIIDNIPGDPNDRKTPLGELNWIFTSITDTIAWNVLPREMFQALFRQDLLVASLFRNYLLADRIMRAFDCTPISVPALPNTEKHPMWEAWDMAAEFFLLQLDKYIQHKMKFQHSSFFSEHLTAFEIWLEAGNPDTSPPMQLPIVLQLLLSQSHRRRALVLLARFLGKGAWAVNLALSVGIFPYVLKLLIIPSVELRGVLVFIWTKILALDRSCQKELVKERYHEYFVNHVASKEASDRQRVMSCFILSCLCDNFPQGQRSLLKFNLLRVLKVHMQSQNSMLRQWSLLCAGKLWDRNEQVATVAVHEGLPEAACNLLNDIVPEVRASALFALGTFLGASSDASRKPLEIAIGKSMAQVVVDGSALVREELVIALGKLVLSHKDQFANAAAMTHLNSPAIGSSSRRNRSGKRNSGSGMRSFTSVPNLRSIVSPTSPRNSISKSPDGIDIRQAGSPQSTSRDRMTSPSPSPPSGNVSPAVSSVVSSSSGSSQQLGAAQGSPQSGPNTATDPLQHQRLVIWKVILACVHDPFPSVAKNAAALRSYVVALKLELGNGAIDKAGKSPVWTASSGESVSSPRGSPVKRVPQNSSSSSSNGVPSLSLGATALPSGNNEYEGPSSPRRHVVASKRLQSNPLPSSPKAKKGSTSPVLRSVRGSTEEDKKAVRSSNKALAMLGSEAMGAITAASGMVEYNVAESLIFERSCEYFSRPIGEGLDFDAKFDQVLNAEWRTKRNRKVEMRANMTNNIPYDETKHGNLDQELAVLPSGFESVGKLLFHPFENLLVVADAKRNIGVWDYKQFSCINSFCNNNPRGSRLTHLSLVNEHYKTLLCTGSDDGVIRLWKDMHVPGEQSLVTSWIAVRNMPRGRGADLVVDWSPDLGCFLAAGALSPIRVWDVASETLIREVKATTGVTSICHVASSELFWAGGMDGKINLFDLRTEQGLVYTAPQELQAPILKLRLQRGGLLDGQMVTCSISGEVLVGNGTMDNASIRRFQTLSPTDAFAVHEHSSIFACGSSKQVIKIYDFEGNTINTIKYHKGFMGTRIGPVSSINFHPNQNLLAAGSRTFISLLAGISQESSDP